MYGWHPTVYKVWAYFILVNMYPLILVERFMLFVYNVFRGDDKERSVTFTVERCNK